MALLMSQKLINALDAISKRYVEDSNILHTNAGPTLEFFYAHRQRVSASPAV
jgi:hypothetical protein